MMRQVEGAFVFGLGMMTTEEVVIDSKSGRLLTDSTWTYKIPTAPCVPSQFNVSFLKVMALSCLHADRQQPDV